MWLSWTILNAQISLRFLNVTFGCCVFDLEDYISSVWDGLPDTTLKEFRSPGIRPG